MIDTHAHIYLPEFDKDRKEAIEKARAQGIEKILMPAIDSATHSAMFQVEGDHEGCISMIGLHPCSVKDDYLKELEVVAGFLSKRSFVAIGEIGLDFYWDTSFKQQQYDAFHRQAQLAILYHLPIAIHSRNSIDECIEVVSQYPGLEGVFHCFSGTEEQARKIIQLNFLLGIGGVVSFKNAGLDLVIKEIGLNNIILETDAPYLAPVPYRGKRNEPAYIKIIAEKLSVLTGKSMEEIEQITNANAGRLFKL